MFSLFYFPVGDVASVDFIKEGCCFVEFKNSDNVNRAIDIMNRYDMNGRKIVVKDEAPWIVRQAVLGLDAQNSLTSSLGLSLGRSSLIGEPNYSDPQGMMAFRSSGLGFSDSPGLSGGSQSLLGPVPERPPFGRSGLSTSPFGGSSMGDNFGRSQRQDLSGNNFLSGGGLGDNFGRSLPQGLSGNNFGNSLNRNGQGMLGGMDAFSDMMGGSSGGGSSRMNKFGNTYGLSIDFLESKGISGPLVKKIFVANIDYKVDEDSLKELFCIAGTVIGVELKKDDNGKSKGHGFVGKEFCCHY